MRIEYHPAVEQDVAEALRRYDAVSRRLGEEFKAELRWVIAVAAAKPGRFHLVKSGFHRANLKRFPRFLSSPRPAEFLVRRWHAGQAGCLSYFTPADEICGAPRAIAGSRHVCTPRSC